MLLKLKIMMMNSIINSHIFTSSIRVKLYKLCGLDIEKGVFLKSGIYMNGTKIKIGEGSGINFGCIFENQERIEIGKKCMIGMEVLFCSATHEIGNESQRMGKLKGLEIKIEDGCWIGSRVTVLPGVTIGRGCVVGAGSLVTRDCLPNGLYVGSPAKRVRELEPGEPLVSIMK